MDKLYYSSERNIQVLIYLLKSHNIKKIIASPGSTNYSFVGSLQHDPFFEIYSCVDERSAAYMACGMAAESGEPVVLTCTGATASRDYYPGLTEAYYRKLPVLAVTSHQGNDRIGQLLPQNIDRRNIPDDIAQLSVELPVVRDQRDEDYVVMQANKAILELYRNGGGPVHINMFTTYSKDFSIKEIEPVRIFQRFFAWDNLPVIPDGKIAIFVGSHRDFTKSQIEAIDKFCATYDALVICDHGSGYYGRYRLLPTLMHFQNAASHPIGKLRLMIHIGESCSASFAGSFQTDEIWRVSEDGELRDPYKRLTKVFQMSEEHFFKHYSKDSQNRHNYIDTCLKEYGVVYDNIPEDLPFSNVWAAQQLSSRIPKGSLLHISVSNTRRAWNMFPLPEGVTSSCNNGACGIDGCTSTLFGASLVNPEKLCYFVTGDLSFFYDLNVLGNRHVGKNLRIMLINNGCGAEFRLYCHLSHALGDEVIPYVSATGHNGNKSPEFVRHIAEDLGFEYLPARSKEEFATNVVFFTDPKRVGKSIIFEVFTTPENESDAVKAMTEIYTDAQGLLRHKVASGIRSVMGESGLQKIKDILGKR